MMVGGSFFYSDRTIECVRFVNKNVGVNYTVIPSYRLGIGYEAIRLRNLILQQEVDLLGNEIFRTASDNDDHNAVICTVHKIWKARRQFKTIWWFPWTYCWYHHDSYFVYYYYQSMTHLSSSLHVTIGQGRVMVTMGKSFFWKRPVIWHSYI